MNTGSTESAITYIDGDLGILRYRGYPIEQLADHEEPSFLETSYLLIYGELPTISERDEFSRAIRKHTLLHEDVKRFFDGFPKDAQPMAILSAVVASLAAFYQDSDDPKDPEQVQLSIVRLMAKLPTIAAYSYKKSIGQPFLYPDNSLDLIENFLTMMFAVPSEHYEVSPTTVHALKQLLILHADHEQNCSTSTVRMVGSSEANLFASIAAGILALWGPLHGGANQEAIEMLQAIEADGGDIDKYVKRAKDPERPLPALGLRAPRLQELRPACAHHQVDRRPRAAGAGRRTTSCSTSRCELEEVALTDEYFIERKLYPNVDFYSGLIYRAMGFPTADVPGAVRDRPAARLDRALEGSEREPEDEARSAPPDLHRARPSASTCRSTSGNAVTVACSSTSSGIRSTISTRRTAVALAQRCRDGARRVGRVDPARRSSPPSAIATAVGGVGGARAARPPERRRGNAVPRAARRRLARRAIRASRGRTPGSPRSRTTGSPPVRCCARSTSPTRCSRSCRARSASRCSATTTRSAGSTSPRCTTATGSAWHYDQTDFVVSRRGAGVGDAAATSSACR